MLKCLLRMFPIAILRYLYQHLASKRFYLFFIFYLFLHPAPRYQLVSMYIGMCNRRRRRWRRRRWRRRRNWWKQSFLFLCILACARRRWSGHTWGTLPDPWRIFLTPRMMSINNFDHIIGFVSQSRYKLMYHTSVDKSKSGHLSGTLPDPWSIFLIPRMMSKSDVDHRSTYKLIYHTSL